MFTIDLLSVVFMLFVFLASVALTRMMDNAPLRIVVTTVPSNVSPISSDEDDVEEEEDEEPSLEDDEETPVMDQ